MSLSYTFATLKSDIQAFAENDAAEFVAVLPTLIGLAEFRIAREADLDVFRKYATSALTAGDKYLNKPADMVIDRSLLVTVNGSQFPVQRKDTSFIPTFWPTGSNENVPRFYSDWDQNTFILAPTPNSNYEVELAYTYRANGLSDIITTTWLSTKAPDLLLFACMVEALCFMKAEKQDIEAWETKYGQALSRVNREEMGRQRRNEFTTGEIRGEI